MGTHFSSFLVLGFELTNEELGLKAGSKYVCEKHGHSRDDERRSDRFCPQCGSPFKERPVLVPTDLFWRIWRRLEGVDKGEIHPVDDVFWMMTRSEHGVHRVNNHQDPDRDDDLWAFGIEIRTVSNTRDWQETATSSVPFEVLERLEAQIASDRYNLGLDPGRHPIKLYLCMSADY